MGIEAIQEEIVNETNKMAEEKIAEASRKSQEIKDATLNLISEEDRKAEKETSDLIESIKNALLAGAKFEVKKIELSSKKEMINRVFEKATEKISSLDLKAQEELTLSLLESAKKEISVAKIICNEKTKRWIPKEFKVETQDMLGGILAETADGTLRVDNRFETIIEEVRKDALKKIAKAIF